jgi:hypothetical protein
MAAAPVEIEIEAHGHPRVALVLCDIELDAFRVGRLPLARLLEIVDHGHERGLDRIADQGD